MNKHFATVARKDFALTGGNHKQDHDSEYRLSAVTGLDLESERERERNVGGGSESWIVRVKERDERFKKENKPRGDDREDHRKQEKRYKLLLNY